MDRQRASLRRGLLCLPTHLVAFVIVANYSTHGTTTANVEADPVILGPQHNYAQVINRTGTAEIWFTVNGSTPSAGGDDCYVVPAGMGGFKVDVPSGQTTVRLISTGIQAYSVVGSLT